MPAWAWIVIAVAAVIVVAVVAYAAWRRARTRELQQQFGSEYDRTIASAPTRREAEAELRGREERRSSFDIRPLRSDEAAEYSSRWRDIQARFVDEPEKSVHQADSLIQEVMRARGYPVDDFDTRAADLSVDHPDVVENYRAAHAIAVSAQRGNADTEQLRHAVKHYRALFDELVVTRERHEVTT